VEWIHLAQDRDQRRAVVNTAMNLRVSKNAQIFGHKRDEIMGNWRKLRNEELHKLYYSPNIITMIKLRGMRWTGHVARI
jgi:hypothetical protein